MYEDLVGRILEMPFNERDIRIDNIASFIDHTNLNPAATEQNIMLLCDEYKEYGFASVCIHPVNVGFVRNYAGNEIVITTVIGFPTGQHTTLVKQREAELALKEGAVEFDMVINIGKLKDKNYKYVGNEIKQIKDTIGKNVLKVIIENCLLEDDEKIIATMLCIDSGADFVKTSTGFSKWGATIEDVNLLYKTANGQIKVKAAGGIRDYKTAISMIRAGADRIGASKSIAIVKGD